MHKWLYLVQFEWKKHKDYNVFKVMSIFYLVLLPSILLIGKKLPKSLNDVGFSIDSVYMFPGVWEYLGYTGNWLVFFFLGFMSVISVTNEYSNKTLRQNIITGLDRKDYFLGKLAWVTTLAFAATLYYVLCGLLFGFLHTETIYWSKVIQNADFIPRYFLMCMGYGSFGMFLGFLIKRTGIAIFLYFAYIFFIERILRYSVHMNLIQHKSMQFYPMNATSDLIHMPMPLAMDGPAAEFSKEVGFEFFLSPTEAVITTAIYSLLFLYASYRIMTRSDL